MSTRRLIRGAGMVVLIFSIAFSTPAFAQTPPEPTVQNFSGSIPADIQLLINKDQKTWTAEENQKVIDFIDSTRPSARALSTTPSGTFNCFDYYRFGSVQVDLSPTLSQTVPGVTMVFVGEVRNTNSYPIVDGHVYVKIFKQKTGESFNQENGLALVDQFPLKESFTLPANGSKKASFTWKVPTNAEDGEYTAAFFFQTAKRYNLLGLSFTDDVTGNQAHFSVVNSDKGNIVTFDKNTVMLNGQQHRFATFPLHFKKDEPVIAAAKLVNPKDEAVTIPVTWKLYSWDGLREETLKDTKTESYELSPKETMEVSYTASPLGATVSYLIAEVDDHTSRSILNIRFVRDGLEETRINFPSITGYPLIKGQENTLFSCVHSTGPVMVEDNTLTLTLVDDKDNVIHTYTYTGGISSAMMGVKDVFTPTKTYATFSLIATLKHEGTLVEEVKETYDCKDIDPSLCPKQASIVPWIVAGILVLLVPAFFRRRFLKNRGTTVLFFVLVAPTLICTIPGQAWAKTVGVTFNPQLTPGLNILGFYEGAANPSGSGIANVSITVNYNATATNYGSSLNDGDPVPMGSTIAITWAPQSSNISWVGTGGYFDSPYGRWDSAAKSCTTYTECTIINSILYGPNWGIQYRGDMIVTPPSFTASGTNLSCGATQGGVITHGPVSAQLCTLLGGSPWCDIVATVSPFTASCTVTASSGPVNLNIAFDSAHADMRGGEFVGYLDRPDYVRSGGANYGAGFTVPAQQISFAFTAGPPNSPPSVPVLTAPGSGIINRPINFNVTSTDQQGDNIRYGFDWDGNTTVDEWVPATGYVPSGTSQAVSHTWATTGSKSMRVKTQDDRGLSSTFAFKSLTMYAAGCADPVLGYVAEGASVTAYSSSAPFPATCSSVSEVRTCTSGVLSGSYTSSTCVNRCALPWGGSLASGQYVTAYQSSIVTYPRVCGSSSRENRSCSSSGVLSGSYTNESCSVAAPTATLSANPAIINTGQSATLTWNSTGANRCTGTGFTISPVSATSSSRSTGVLATAGTRTYQVICTNPNSTNRTSLPAIATVDVIQPAPTLTISADPMRVRANGISTITWTAAGASSCTVSGPGLSTSNHNGSANVTPTTQSSYIIACDGVSKSTILNVVPEFGEF